MIVTYIRSSSYNNFDFCQMQYYLNYVLGIPRKVNTKADKGTAVHKVLEILANIKKDIQHNGERSFIYFDNDNPNSLSFDINIDKFLSPTVLTHTEVNLINDTRKNKWKYLPSAKIDYGHIRYGVELVDKIITQVANIYQAKSEDKWSPADFKDVINWTWMALDYKNGMFDPRRRQIVLAEPHFDITIKRDWAKYNVNGKTGHLAIRGTVDLITELEPGILEIIDWKTGQRKDWATDQIKDFKKLSEDPQLMLYYYAAKHMFPDIKQVIVSIFFIRSGGPFTVCFDESHIALMEQMLCRRFHEINKCSKPKMIDSAQNSPKCTFMCDYYKTLSEDGKTNICKYIHDKIHEVGIDAVTEKYTQIGHDINNYQSPGELD